MSKLKFEDYELMIHKICNRFRKFAETRGIEYADLYQTGALGLLEAMDRYDDSKGSKPSTYFHQYIFWKIHEEITPMRERKRFASGGPVVIYTNRPRERCSEGEQHRVDDRDEIDRILGMFSDRDQEILRAYGTGHGPRALAKTYGCTRQNIHRIVNEFRKAWHEMYA